MGQTVSAGPERHGTEKEPPWIGLCPIPSVLPVFSILLCARLRDGEGHRSTWTLLVLTLIFQLESWPVLGVVTVKIHGGLVGRGEQGAWKVTSTESAHHAAGLVGAVPDFYEVMVGLGGEVQELDVSSWEQDRGG